MKNKNTVTVIGGFCADSPFFAMTHEQFVDHCGGEIAVALFKGEIRRAVYNVISMAIARGMKYQIEQTSKSKSGLTIR